MNPPPSPWSAQNVYRRRPRPAVPDAPRVRGGSQGAGSAPSTTPRTGTPPHPSASAREHEPRARVAADAIVTGAAKQELQRERAVRTPEAKARSQTDMGGTQRNEGPRNDVH